MATYTAPNYPSQLKAGDVINFQYSDDYYTFVANEELTLLIEVWGAACENSGDIPYISKGGYAKGELKIANGESLIINLGKMSSLTSNSLSDIGTTNVRKEGNELSNRIIAAGYEDSQTESNQINSKNNSYASPILSNTLFLSGCSTMPSPYNGTQVGQSGNGHCRITVLDVKNIAVKIRIGSDWKTSNEIKVRKNNQWIEAKAIKVFRNGKWEDAKT